MTRRQGRRRPRRRAKKTVLVVGEGHSEAEFLRHLKSLYAPRDCGVSVTVSNAQGKGPAHVIDHTLGQMRSPGDYNLVAALLDDDVSCPQAHLRKACDHGIDLIWSSPCFEALLLEILGEYTPSRTQHCKARFDTTYGIDRCHPAAYGPLFPKTVLEQRRRTVRNLDVLCRLMEGNPPLQGQRPSR
jgi:hypothetical protein